MSKSKKLDDALYQFADDGSDRKDAILKNVMQKINLPIKPKIRYRKHIIAAVSLCLVIVVIGNFNVIASSINKVISTLFPAENIMINEINTNYLRELIDARLSEGKGMADTADVADDGSLEYQILFKPVETPCYVYLHYYRGYLKTITLDKQTKNIEEVEDWLRNNAGIVARVAETPEEAAQFFENGSSVTIILEQLRTVMGGDCMIPDYLPDGKSGNTVQYNKDMSRVNITYFYKGSADFDTSGEINNYIVVDITKADTIYSENLIANLTVTQTIKTEHINGYDVYISDAYYVWKNNGFVYVLYSACTTHDENMKIIENMK